MRTPLGIVTKAKTNKIHHRGESKYYLDWTRSFLKVSRHRGRSLHGSRHSETVLNFSVDICLSYPSSILTEAFLSLPCLSVSRNHFPSEIHAVFFCRKSFLFTTSLYLHFFCLFGKQKAPPQDPFSTEKLYLLLF